MRVIPRLKPQVVTDCVKVETFKLRILSRLKRLVAEDWTNVENSGGQMKYMCRGKNIKSIVSIVKYSLIVVICRIEDLKISRPAFKVNETSPGSGKKRDKFCIQGQPRPAFKVNETSHGSGKIKRQVLSSRSIRQVLDHVKSYGKKCSVERCH